jgi:hypothetical protein
LLSANANIGGGRSKAREFRELQEQLTNSAQHALRLAELRYQGGTTSYLEVLDSETRLFAAELALAQARRNELSRRCRRTAVPSGSGRRSSSMSVALAYVRRLARPSARRTVRM